MLRYLHAILLLTASLGAHAQQTADSINQGTVMAWFQDQQYEQAAQYLQARVQPTSVKQLALLGYACYQGGKWPQTIHTYQQILGLDSNYLPAHQYLGSIYMQQEQPLLAIPHYQKLVSLQPQQAQYYKQLSSAWFAAHIPDTGFVYLQKAYALAPLDSKIVARMAEEWLDRARYAAADSVLQPYLATDSLQPAVLIPAVKTAYYRKNYEQAIALGQRLIRLRVISVAACTYLTAACYYTKRYQECINVSDFLTQANSTSEAIMYYAAMAATQLKDYARSNELLLLCINMAKSKSLDDYYTGMSANYEGLRAYKQATACLDTAFYLFHVPLRQYSIARIYDQRLKNPAAAKRYYQRYLQLAKPEEQDELAIYRYVQERMK